MQSGLLTVHAKEEARAGDGGGVCERREQEEFSRDPIRYSTIE